MLLMELVLLEENGVNKYHSMTNCVEKKNTPCYPVSEDIVFFGQQF